MYLNVYQDTFIRFRDTSLNQFIRKKQFNELDFLSFVGGLLGLFAGFSAISFVEFIYWFTVRLLIEMCQKTKLQVHPVGSNENQQVSVKKSYFESYFKESTIHGLRLIFGYTKIDT